jgi:Ca2+-binding RTX toxin-like protein
MTSFSTDVRWTSATLDFNLTLRQRTGGFFTGPQFFADQVRNDRIFDQLWAVQYPGYDSDDILVTERRSGQAEIGAVNPVFNNANRLVNGRLDYYADYAANNNFRFGFFDTGIGIAPLLAARATPGRGDDLALVARMFAGDDNIALSRFSDVISGRGGNDRINGDAGNDRLSGGNAGDLIYGGPGADQLIGGDGNDLLFGLGGPDRLSGGDGADVLTGGTQNDRMAGGAGSDRFVFYAGNGQDVVTDFGRGGDRLVIFGADSISDLTILRTQGGDTRISYGGTVILLDGVRPSEITAADFLFGAAATASVTGATPTFFSTWDYAAG